MTNTSLKATLLVTSTLTALAGAIIAPSLPAIRDHFSHVPHAEFWVRLILTLPALFIVLGAPIAGFIVDKFGRKPLLVSAVILYGIAGSSGYFAPSIEWILLGRAILGVAVSAIITSVTTLITDYFEGPARSQFLGFQSAFMGIGGTVYLTLGGLLADIEWRAPFLIYAFAFIILPAVLLTLYEPPVRTHTPSDAPLPIAILPLKLLFFIYAISAFTQAVFYTVPVQLPFFLEEMNGSEAAASGLAIATMTLCFSLASARYGWLAQRYSQFTMIVLGLFVIGVGYGLIGAADGYGLLAGGLIVGGFGLGMVIPTLPVWLANTAPLALRGRVLGGYATAVFLGQFISPFLSQPLSETLGYAGMYGVVSGAVGFLAITLIVFRT